MKCSLRFRLFATVLLCLGGGAHFCLAVAPNEVPPASANPQDFVPVIVRNEVEQAKAEIETRAVAYLKAGDFAALDTMARDFRTSQAAFANGYWKLSLFYQAVAGLDVSAPESECQTRLALLRRWFDLDAASVTARVALARALVCYAWHARGCDLTQKVKPEASQLVSERIGEANLILETAKGLPEKCPYWYSTWMTKAMLAGDNQQRVDEICAEGLQRFPSYTPIYFMKAWWLEECWYGRPGDWEAFAKESADRLGGEKGDILYAQILWWIHDSRLYGNPIAQSVIEWPRVRRGFEAIRRQQPDSLLALSEFCSISGFAPQGARKLMRQLFDELGNRVDLQTWKKVDLFVRDRRWAYSLQ
jgi:hypothetical protein